MARGNKIFENILQNLLTKHAKFDIIIRSNRHAGMAQLVEHVIGNDEVISSTLITSSRSPTSIEVGFLVFIDKKPPRESAKTHKRCVASRVSAPAAQNGYVPRVSAFAAPPPGGAHPRRVALVALRRARNNLGVSLLLTFLFAPAVSKRKVAKGAERQYGCWFWAEFTVASLSVFICFANRELSPLGD